MSGHSYDQYDHSFDKAALDRFWRFVAERQSIWHKRTVLKLPPPWTDDPVLRDYRFTNVYRELDVGTRYCMKHILAADADRKDKAFNVMVYRLVGRASTHYRLGFTRARDFTAEKFIAAATDIRAEGSPVYTGAYMVSSYGPGSMDRNVGAVLAELASGFDPFWAELNEYTQPETAFELIKTRRGYGDFLAYQVLVDMTYQTPAGSVLNVDLSDWSKAGPGAEHGLARLFATENCAGIDALGVMLWLRDHQEAEFARLGLDFKHWVRDGAPVRISVGNIENCLCESWKYTRALEGGAMPRARFRGGVA